ncbi:unnamed protein product, partial [marine sediment metagenome]
MKTLILALGNPILSDDSAAHVVADRLAERLSSSCVLHEESCQEANTPYDIPNTQYKIIKSSAATMDIIPQLVGYQRLVVIDTIQLGSAPPGTVHRFALDDLANTIRISSP